ncbi:MAG: hypothetical protein AAGI71_17750 [Bacteroidota bacterium]
MPSWKLNWAAPAALDVLLTAACGHYELYQHVLDHLERARVGHLCNLFAPDQLTTESALYAFVEAEMVRSPHRTAFLTSTWPEHLLFRSGTPNGDLVITHDAIVLPWPLPLQRLQPGHLSPQHRQAQRTRERARQVIQDYHPIPDFCADELDMSKGCLFVRSVFNVTDLFVRHRTDNPYLARMPEVPSPQGLDVLDQYHAEVIEERFLPLIKQNYPSSMHDYIDEEMSFGYAGQCFDAGGRLNVSSHDSYIASADGASTIAVYLGLAPRTYDHGGDGYCAEDDMPNLIGPDLPGRSRL